MNNNKWEFKKKYLKAENQPDGNQRPQDRSANQRAPENENFLAI